MSESNQRHPNSTFQATYPYNQSTITRGGHELQFNDTPDHESIKLAHTKGTYIEMESSGRWNQVVTEKLYSYIKSSMTQTVDSHYDLKIAGTHTLNIDQSSFEAVGQDKTTGVGGNLVDGVSGVRELHTEGDRFETVNGDSVLGVKGDSHTAVQGDAVTSITGVKSDMLESDWFVASASSIEMNAEGTFRIKCKQFIVEAETILLRTISGDVTIESAAQLFSSSQDRTTFNSTGDFIIDSQAKVTSSSSGDTSITSSGQAKIESPSALIQGGTVDINGAVKINGVIQVGN